jgi:hypothetical protein
MSKVFGALGFVVIALCGAVTAQQTRPDLSGRWELAADKSTPAGARPTLGTSIGIQQSATAVTIESKLPGMTASPGPDGRMGPPEQTEFNVTTAYTFDGAEHQLERNIEGMPTMAQAPPGAMVSMPPVEFYRATWTTGQLVVITQNKPGAPGNPMAPSLTRVSRLSFTLEADGSLVVESMVIVQPREGGPKQAAPVPTRTVYVRRP